MRRAAFRLVTVLLFLVAAMPARAQQIPVDSTRTDSSGTVFKTSVVLSDTTAALADTSRHHALPKKSTTTAMLLSALLPGAGQAYNQSYWKVPIVLGFGLYFVSSWLDNNRRYLEYRDKYSASITPENPSGSGSFLSTRDFWRDQRDGFTWYFLILYALNIVDAYVDASLYDFNVGNDLSIRMMPAGPAWPGNATGLRMELRFSGR